MKVEKSAGRSCMSASSRTLTIPFPSGRGAQEVGDVELRRAEEGVRLLLLELDDLADDDADGRGRDAAVLLHLLLAGIRVEVVEERAQVGQVDERQALVVGVLEGERQDALLGLVELEHLRQQDRSEARAPTRGAGPPCRRRSRVRNSTGKPRAA